jgi:hypothetical protein
MPPSQHTDPTPEAELAALVAELGSHTAALTSRTAELADDLHVELTELRSELRGELTHFGRSVRADTLRLRRELLGELAITRQALGDLFDAAAAKLIALLVAGPLLVIAATTGAMAYLS